MEGGKRYMTDSQKTIDAKKAGTVNSIVAGVAGVVAGGMAVAAAVVMSDKKNQKKVKDAWAGAKEKVEKVTNDTKKKIEDKV
jgi:hypothetical protein